MGRTWFRLLGATLAVGVVVAVAGCGSDPDQEPSTGSRNTPSAQSRETPVDRASTTPVDITVPGSNGPIAFRQFAPETAGDPAPLYSVTADGTEVIQISDRPGFFSDWRSDGQRIAFDFFEPDGDEQIATAWADGSHLRVITRGPGIHEVPSWSPSGDRIVFNYSPDLPDSPDFETRLWTMRANGTDAQPLPMDSRGFDVEPRWSPDGRWIVFDRLRFTSSGEQLQAVFVVSTTSHDVRRLTPWSLSAEHPTWSPDSRLVAFSTPEGTLMTVRTNGTARRTILPASEGSGGHKPWFSPDGSHILFMCENRGTLSGFPEDYNEDLCVMGADGTDIVKVIDTPETFENWPSWPLSP